MRFVYRLEPRDYQALIEAHGLRRRFGQPGAWLWYTLGAANLAFVGFWVLVAPPSTRAMVLALLSGAFAVFALAAPFLYRSHMQRAVRGHPAHGHEVVAELTGSEIVATYGETVERFAYPAVLSIDERPDHLLLWIARRRAIILPKRGLTGRGSIADVCRHIEERRGAMADIEEQERLSPTAARTPWVRRTEGEHPVFEKTATPDIGDYRAVHFPDGHFARPFTLFAMSALLGLAVACVLGFPAWRRQDYAALALFLAGGLLAGLLLAYLMALLFRRLGAKIFEMEMREQGVVDVPVRFRFDRAGMEWDAKGVVSQVAWPNFVDIEEDDARYIFWLSTKQAASIRKDVFGQDERKDFDKALEGWYGRAPRTPPRMARERTLPSETASDPKTDTV